MQNDQYMILTLHHYCKLKNERFVGEEGNGVFGAGASVPMNDGNILSEKGFHPLICHFILQRSGIHQQQDCKRFQGGEYLRSTIGISFLLEVL